MQSPEQQFVESLLAPHYPSLRHAFYTSFDQMRQATVDAWATSRPRSRASLFHDYLVQNIRNAFEGHPHIHCVDIRGMFLCVIKDRVALRVKKLDDKLLSSNHYTQQSLSFVNQQMQLPTIEKSISLNLGYTIGPYWTRIDGVYITCPSGTRHLLWTIDINDKIHNIDKIIVLPVPGDEEDDQQVFPKGEMPSDAGTSSERREKDELGGHV